ncbi:HAD hydrolase-like protein, partial [bacterium]|nr:HAD hydrolase-like protein [bacterium]
MKYKAIIFDFDGVIGKTMEDNYRAWSNAFSHHNISLARKEYFLLEGMSARSVAETILKKNNMDIILAGTIAEQKEQYYLRNNSFEFYPNVLKLIDTLQA